MRGTRFIETDMAVVAYSHEHDIDTARFADCALVRFRFSVRIVRQTIRHVPLVRGAVDVSKQISVHVSGVGLGMIGAQPDIFVEVEAANVSPTGPIRAKV